MGKRGPAGRDIAADHELGLVRFTSGGEAAKHCGKTPSAFSQGISGGRPVARLLWRVATEEDMKAQISAEAMAAIASAGTEERITTAVKLWATPAAGGDREPVSGYAAAAKKLGVTAAPARAGIIRAIATGKEYNGWNWAFQE